MTEENKEVEVTEVTTEEQTQPEVKEPEVSEVEKKALEMGWKPKDNFEGEETDFIDAAEFVRRKPLFDKIDNVGKELRETKKALRALQAHHEKVKEAEYQHALKALREEKRAALESGDADKLIEIDDRITDVKAYQAAAQQQAAQQVAQPHPNFVKWVESNQWYKSNAELRVLADQIGTSYAASNPSEDPDRVLEYVAKRVKKLYPEMFTNPNKTRPSAVEGSRQTPSQQNSKDDDSDVALTDDERKAMMAFVRQGIMTKADYIKEIKRTRGV